MALEDHTGIETQRDLWGAGTAATQMHRINGKKG
jgi:hypothetical protein